MLSSLLGVTLAAHPDPGPSVPLNSTSTADATLPSYSRLDRVSYQDRVIQFYETRCQQYETQLKELRELCDAKDEITELYRDSIKQYTSAMTERNEADINRKELTDLLFAANKCRDKRFKELQEVSEGMKVKNEELKEENAALKKRNDGLEKRILEGVRKHDRLIEEGKRREQELLAAQAVLREVMKKKKKNEEREKGKELWKQGKGISDRVMDETKKQNENGEELVVLGVKFILLILLVLVGAAII